MLDLEVIPERSLGCDNWEFVLGEFISYIIISSTTKDFFILPMRNADTVLFTCSSCVTIRNKVFFNSIRRHYVLFNIFYFIYHRHSSSSFN